jgi:hypothetical protein
MARSHNQLDPIETLIKQPESIQSRVCCHIVVTLVLLTHLFLDITKPLQQIWYGNILQTSMLSLKSFVATRDTVEPPPGLWKVDGKAGGRTRADRVRKECQ